MAIGINSDWQNDDVPSEMEQIAELRRLLINLKHRIHIVSPVCTSTIHSVDKLEDGLIIRIGD